MVQSINSVAIRSTASLLLKNRSHFVPHYRFKDINQINFGALKAGGCRAVVFDKDNVLTAPYAKELHISVQPGWERCRRVFGEDVYIMSNSAGSADDAPLYNEAGALEATLGARVIRHGIKKPGGGAELLAAAGHDPKHIAFVGDRLLTDVVFANTHGLLAIHTQPLTLVNDNYWAKQIRRLENGALRTWLRGVTPPAHALACLSLDQGHG